MSDKKFIGKNILAGATGGFVGAAVMGAMMVIARRMGVDDTPPPLKIERELENRLDVDWRTNQAEEKWLASAEHLGLGAGMGAGYGLMHAFVGSYNLLSGVIYGLFAYLRNYAYLGPKFNLTAGPWNQEPVTVIRRALLHVVFGVVNALVAKKLIENWQG